MAKNILIEVTYNGTTKVSSRACSKERIMLPVMVSDEVGCSYNVALALEDTVPKEMFDSQQDFICRIKSRASFTVEIPSTSSINLMWRIDMTIVRQLSKTEATKSTINKFIDSMFFDKTESSKFMIPNPQEYKFEIEAEFIEQTNADSVRPADITNIAKFIYTFINVNYTSDIRIRDEIKRAASYLNPRGKRRYTLKQMLPAVQAITRGTYKLIYPPTGMYVTEKADGVRSLALVHDGSSAVVSNTIRANFVPTTQKMPYMKDTILDGEYITMADGTQEFFAFDIIVLNGVDLTKEPFSVRYTRLEAGVAILNESGIVSHAKTFTILTENLEAEITAANLVERPYAKDGLILTQGDQPYEQTSSYKWKPIDQTTIDFLPRRINTSDRDGFDKYYLFVGISASSFASFNMTVCDEYLSLFPPPTGQYFPVQFSPSYKPLAYIYYHPHGGIDIENKITEFRYVSDSWELVRLRTDRDQDFAAGGYFGNDFTTAEITWLNYLDPFNIEQLWGNASDEYFMTVKDISQETQAGVINLLKSTRIKTFTRSKIVVDIGAGKGQDLGKYFNAGIGHVVAIDADAAALAELIRRKYSHAKTSKTTSTVHVIVADINDGYEHIIPQLHSVNVAPNTADVIVCNLAVHYFLQNTSHAKNFIDLVMHTLRVGGKLVLTIFNGALIHDMLMSNGITERKSWDIFEGTPPVRKYSIKRMYSSDSLEPVGQQIGVQLPFSRGDYYTEYLTNPNYLISEFEMRNFKLTDRSCASDMISEFAARNGSKKRSITDGDRQWLSLYGELEFTRMA
jgi:hypothetical protein